MTADEIEELCAELKEVINTKIEQHQMSEAQLVFWTAFEDASYDGDLLSAYSNMIQLTPEISLRNLHSFLMGHAFGIRMGGDIVKKEVTSH